MCSTPLPWLVCLVVRLSTCTREGCRFNLWWRTRNSFVGYLHHHHPCWVECRMQLLDVCLTSIFISLSSPSTLWKNIEWGFKKERSPTLPCLYSCFYMPSGIQLQSWLGLHTLLPLTFDLPYLKCTHFSGSPCPSGTLPTTKHACRPHVLP